MILEIFVPKTPYICTSQSERYPFSYPAALTLTMLPVTFGRHATRLVSPSAKADITNWQVETSAELVSSASMTRPWTLSSVTEQYSIINICLFLLNNRMQRCQSYDILSLFMYVLRIRTFSFIFVDVYLINGAKCNRGYILCCQYHKALVSTGSVMPMVTVKRKYYSICI